VFQLLDGIVGHKVLRLHQVRYDVDRWAELVFVANSDPAG
jgi:uncharacterized membrane protein